MVRVETLWSPSMRTRRPTEVTEMRESPPDFGPPLRVVSAGACGVADDARRELAVDRETRCQFYDFGAAVVTM